MLNSIADVMILFTETTAQHGRVCCRDWEGEQPPVHQLCQAGAGDVSTPSSCYIMTSAANRLIGEVVQSRRRPLLGPSLG